MVANPPTLLRNQRNARIVVIGAGPSGIGAATRLLENGFKNVVILEAENRIGGRINTQPFGDNVIDLGAQWCHGEENNIVYERVKNLNMLETTGEIYNDFLCIRSNREVVPDDVASVLKTVGNASVPRSIQALISDQGSLGVNMTDKYWRDIEGHRNVDRAIAQEYFDNFKKFQCLVKGSDNVFQVSGRGHLEYRLCAGDLHLNWRDKGYHSFLNVLMNSKGQNDLGMLTNRVLLNRRVQNIDWSNPQRILIRMWNGEIIEADHVICTVSLGVLKENYRTMFSPMLPNTNCRAIEGLNLGMAAKLFLEFAEPLSDQWPDFCLLWREEDLQELRNSNYFWLESVFGFYRVSYQPRLLLGWTVGPHARYMETLPEAVVQAGLLWLLRRFLSFPVPDPINFKRSQWYSNPNFRGTYSFRSPLTVEMRTGAWDLAEPVLGSDGRPVLQFAGEATHSHYFSTVHGALESGYREAARLTDFYGQYRGQL